MTGRVMWNPGSHLYVYSWLAGSIDAPDLRKIESSEICLAGRGGLVSTGGTETSTSGKT